MDIENPSGGEPAAPVNDAPAPSPAAEPASPAPSPSLDPQQLYSRFEQVLEQKLSSRDQEWQGYLRQESEKRAKAEEAQRMELMRIFNPELHKEKTAPKYVTVEELNKVREEAIREANRTHYQAQFNSQLETVREKFPRVAEMYGDALSDALFKPFVESGNAVKAAAALDAKIGKLLEAQSQQLQQNKQVMQQHVRGNGAPGKAPSTPTGDNHGFRGRGRLVALRKGQL